MQRASPIPIGIIGDFDSTRPTHVATEASLVHAADALGLAVQPYWLATSALFDTPLEACAAFIVAPGSPYLSLAGALHAIRLARESRRPVLGTCGGFQHVVVEFTRNVLGVRGAQHAEYDPHAPDLVIDQLACSLAGQRAGVKLHRGSRAASFYGTESITEDFRCSFGLSVRYEPALERAGLAISGRGENGEPRIVELREHPFYVATLFVPQLSSAPQRPHPLLRAFVAAADGSWSAA